MLIVDFLRKRQLYFIINLISERVFILHCKTPKILCLLIFDDLHHLNCNKVLFLKFSYCKNAQILHFGKTKNFEFFQTTWKNMLKIYKFFGLYASFYSILNLRKSASSLAVVISNRPLILLHLETCTINICIPLGLGFSIEKV